MVMYALIISSVLLIIMNLGGGFVGLHLGQVVEPPGAAAMRLLMSSPLFWVLHPQMKGEGRRSKRRTLNR